VANTRVRDHPRFLKGDHHTVLSEVISTVNSNGRRFIEVMRIVFSCGQCKGQLMEPFALFRNIMVNDQPVIVLTLKIKSRNGNAPIPKQAFGKMPACK
jgi:hypothetical protein